MAGDAWPLDPADSLAVRPALDGDPEDLYFEETDTNFAIGWKGNYQIEGDAFLLSTATPYVSQLFPAIPPAGSLSWPDRKTIEWVLPPPVLSPERAHAKAPAPRGRPRVAAQY